MINIPKPGVVNEDLKSYLIQLVELLQHEDEFIDKRLRELDGRISSAEESALVISQDEEGYLTIS